MRKIATVARYSEMEGSVSPTAERGNDSREKSAGVGRKDSDKRVIRGTKGEHWKMIIHEILIDHYMS